MGSDQAAMLEKALEKSEQANIVLLAGDLYDRAQPSEEAIRMMSRFWLRISRLSKPAFAVNGNHSSPEEVSLGERGW